MADTEHQDAAQPAQTPRNGSLLADLPSGPFAAGGAEDILPLVTHGGGRIERIVSAGQANPPGFWYDNDEDEFVLLVAGAAVLTIAGRDEALRLGPGDWVNLPAHCRHRVEWTSAAPPTVWLTVFSRRQT